MIRTDCHMHSEFSSDSHTPIEDMIKGSIKKRLTTICFTEHMDYNFPSKYNLPFVFDVEEYFHKTDELINRYSSDITILRGIEIGLKSGTEEKYNTLMNNYPWDYVIGSIHLIDDYDPYYPEYWQTGNEHYCIRHYFETIYDNITSYDNFDSIGHLDYVLRYAPNRNRIFYYNDYADIIDKILRYIISKDIALEINSAGYKAGLNQPNPSKEILRRYIDLGGRLYTIGSDAHNPEYIAGYFNDTEMLLKDMSINEYAVYRKRIPFPVHI